MTDPLKVLVVGGGIAGGVLSLGLAQKGVEVVLVDLRSELGGVGHGITLQGNALKAFQAVGIYDRLAEHGFAFSHLRMKSPDGHTIMEIPTPPMGGPDLPGTMGALRGDLADILADEVTKAGVDVRLGTTITSFDDRGGSADPRVVVTLSDGSTETVDLLVGADGIRSKVRSMMGITDEPKPVGMGIWRTVAKRPAEMDCSELYFGGPKYKAGYTPISEDLCYAFLLEENLDRSYLGEGPRGAELKERGQGYGGTWGQVRDSLADDAIVNYQWIEAICVESPWYRGRTIIIGDAAHACPPLIAQGAAMCAEDAVILAEMLTAGPSVDEVLPAFMERRFPRVKMVLDNSLTLAEWEIHPETPGADPGRIMGQTLGALVAPA
ncbi:FAD-dependent monooxygenase [Nocardioides islandensis]|uniref:FAD-dependent monooxygenase n=1 Tax=Nocardioides islandensis TaxID=433663 RepID=A0A930VDQ6_9ACTN|nr:FAD-dependent monooxygenase [Nocardioides islandensis]MBF4764672.1 FAD-dependent monooxygenase [Nocardioides islandensis]